MIGYSHKHRRGHGHGHAVYGQMDSTGCNRNLLKLVVNKIGQEGVPDVEQFFRNVCGPRDLDYLMYRKADDRVAIKRAHCRCDSKAKQYLEPKDQVPLDVRCDCGGSAELTGKAKCIVEAEDNCKMMGGCEPGSMGHPDTCNFAYPD